MENVKIRVASPDDAKELLDIYSHYVLNTAISFEYDVPSLGEFTDRIKNTLSRYPYLTAVKNGELVGYAYTSAFHERCAYRWCAETSVYIKNGLQKSGLGKRLYAALEGVSKAQNLLSLYACIAYPENDDEYLTDNSARFHEHLGYELVGECHRCGYKFGRWYNMMWMEKQLAERTALPTPVIPFPELEAAALAAQGIEV